MIDDLRSPNVPTVNLLDPSIEPTEDELEAMMKDVHLRAIRRRDAVFAAFWAEIDAGIKNRL